MATDIQGASAMAMIRGLIAGQADAAQLAQLAQGRMRAKIPELEQALQGGLSDNQRLQLQVELEHVTALDSLIERLSKRIEELTAPFKPALERLDEIPGINRRAAENILAETGTDMGRFPSAGHLASWAGLCPGNNESAGKKRSGRTRNGDTWLRTTLVECAWGASRKRNSYLQAHWRRLRTRRGEKRAVVGVAHTLLVIIYQLLKEEQSYHDLGAAYLDRMHGERPTKALVKRLEKLGHKVTLEPVKAA